MERWEPRGMPKPVERKIYEFYNRLLELKYAGILESLSRATSWQQRGRGKKRIRVQKLTLELVHPHVVGICHTFLAQFSNEGQIDFFHLPKNPNLLEHEGDK
jgi:hypothetical protein